MKNDSSSPRIRFNWGFHDGAHDKNRGIDRRNIAQGELHCLPKWDDIYNAGYMHGQSADMQRVPDTSEPAWKAYKAQREKESTERKALRDARPSWRTVIC